jgi:hypothetical protein
VLWIFKNVLRQAMLYNVAIFHDQHSMRQSTHNLQIMADE